MAFDGADDTVKACFLIEMEREKVFTAQFIFKSILIFVLLTSHGQRTENNQPY
jgi:hypothetical protein